MEPLPTIDPVVERAVQALVVALHPLNVVLFGSRARGNAGLDSDYDFLVVAETPLPSHERGQVASRALRGLGVPTDVLVLTPAEYGRLSTWTSSVVYSANEEGTVVYEAA